MTLHSWEADGDLTWHELGLLRRMVEERIHDAEEGGISPTDSSSVFRDILWKKLNRLEREAMKREHPSATPPVVATETHQNHP